MYEAGETVSSIAKICHDTNRSYCQTLGDNSQLPWEEAPDWQKISAMKGVEFHLAALSSGLKPSNSDSHNSWLAEKREQGWKYGPVKNAETKEHPCFLPYEELPEEQRMKDKLFGMIVWAFYSSRLIGN